MKGFATRPVVAIVLPKHFIQSHSRMNKQLTLDSIKAVAASNGGVAPGRAKFFNENRYQGASLAKILAQMRGPAARSRIFSKQLWRNA